MKIITEQMVRKVIERMEGAHVCEIAAELGVSERRLLDVARSDSGVAEALEFGMTRAKAGLLARMRAGVGEAGLGSLLALEAKVSGLVGRGEAIGGGSMDEGDALAEARRKYGLAGGGPVDGPDDGGGGMARLLGGL